MIGDDTHAHVVLVVGAVVSAGDRGSHVEHRANLVDLVHVLDALFEERDALHTHAGVDVLLRQFAENLEALTFALAAKVLHEDEVPDLDVPVVVGGWAAFDAVLRPAVKEDLRARTGRARLTGRPVVGIHVQTLDSLVRQPGGLLPEVDRLVVVFVDRDPQVFLLEAEPAIRFARGQQLPRELDRVLFEIVAERKVAVHLEERSVARRLADLFDVEGANALLHARGARVRRGHETGEVRDERHHSSDRKQ